MKKDELKVIVLGKQKTGKTTLTYLIGRSLIENDFDVDIVFDEGDNKEQFINEVSHSIEQKIQQTRNKNKVIIEEKTSSPEPIENTETVTDFLGQPIRKGQRAVRVHEYGHDKEFKKCTIKKIEGDRVGVLTDGNQRLGWTFPYRLIVEENFKKSL